MTNESSNPSRLMALDFLRGVAVILVLFRHYYLVKFAQTMGWIGVDLFFVLSGFLISGLLFKEYHKFGNVKAGRFLIRRGFKIYPLFYISLIFTLVILAILHKPVDNQEILGEVFFLQNYVGFIWNHTWSLAVEEHFYLLVAVLLPLLMKYKLFERHRLMTTLFIALLVAALAIRFLTNWLNPEGINFYQTHLRFDSLLAGVFISYFYHFRKSDLSKFYQKFRKVILPVALLLLSFTPWINPFESFFVKTIGFTLIYLAFGLVLIYFLMTTEMPEKLSGLLSNTVANWVYRIGYYSYGIYLFHLFIARYFMVIVRKMIPLPNPINFLIYFAASILVGIVASRLIEIPMLQWRDKHFPARTSEKLN